MGIIEAFSLKGEFGNIVIQGDSGGLVIDLSSMKRQDLKITLITDASVQLCPPAGGQVNKPGVVQASLEKRACKVGDVLRDGTIYAGISPDTGDLLFVTPKDAPSRMQWEEAMRYAADIDAHGHKDWSLPSKTELNVLFKNRAAIGEVTNGYYWSSTEYDTANAWTQIFSTGTQFSNLKTNPNDVRCVRRVPQPGL